MANDNQSRNRQAALKQQQARSQADASWRMGALKRYAPLTKRNQEYMVKLERHLIDRGLDEGKRTEALTKMTQELITQQKMGKTAVKLFGTVNERAKEIIEGPKTPAKPQPFWVAALDNILIMFMLFALMFAFMLTFSSKSASTSQMGLITLFGTSIIAGVGMAYFYREIQPQPNQPKKPFWKTMVMMLALIVVWMFLYFLMALIPASINYVAPALGYLILAAVAFGIRLYLKQKLGFVSPFARAMR